MRMYGFVHVKRTHTLLLVVGVPELQRMSAILFAKKFPGRELLSSDLHNVIMT